MVDAPVGAVALAFTDVQGSTPLWERNPALMRRVVPRHHAILRSLIDRHSGYEVKTEGDAFMVAFQDPAAAVHWCVGVQEALLEESWPAELLSHPEAAEARGSGGEVSFRGLRVRAGVHVGRPDCAVDPVSGRMDYYGPMVNRAARVMHAAHGGQVLATRDAWRDCAARAPVRARDLGEFELKGLQGLVGLVEVEGERPLQRRFPPPRAGGAARTNLTPARTRLFGRAAEVERIRCSIADGSRLISLVGPGGVGKTRLARAAGAALVDDMPGGVWLVELAAAHDADAVVEALATALRITLPAGLTPEARATLLSEALRARAEVLLVLDNLEQVIEPARKLVSCWLNEVPELHVLTTTQHRLGLAGEEAVEVRGLAGADAQALLVERARRVRPSFAPDGSSDALIADIVRRLDGQPLALELVAARAGLMTLQALHDRLNDRFALLSGGARDAAARHQALRATLEWSWSLLGTDEQTALVVLASLPAGFDIELAESLLEAVGLTNGLELVQALHDKSMLRAFEPAGLPGALYLGPYESVRAFAREQPGSDQARLLAWAAKSARSELARWKAAPDARLMGRLRINIDNYHAILRAALAEPSGPETAWNLFDVIEQVVGMDSGPTSSAYSHYSASEIFERIVELTARVPALHSAVLHRYLTSQGRPSRGGRFLETYERVADPNSPPALRLRALLASEQDDLGGAREAAERAWAAARELDAEERYACAVARLRASEPYQSHSDRARAALADLDESARELVYLASRVEWERGNLLLALDEHEAALAAKENGLRLARQHGLRYAERTLEGNKGGSLFHAGYMQRAAAQFELALEQAELAGDSSSVTQWCLMLGRTAFILGRDDQARAYWQRAAALQESNPSRAWFAQGWLAILDLTEGKAPTPSPAKLAAQRVVVATKRYIRLALALESALSGDLAATREHLASMEQLPEPLHKVLRGLEAALEDVAIAVEFRGSDPQRAREALESGRARLGGATQHGEVQSLARIVEKIVARLEGPPWPDDFRG